MPSLPSHRRSDKCSTAPRRALPLPSALGAGITEREGTGALPPYHKARRLRWAGLWAVGGCSSWWGGPGTRPTCSTHTFPLAHADAVRVQGCRAAVCVGGGHGGRAAAVSSVGGGNCDGHARGGGHGPSLVRSCRWGIVAGWMPVWLQSMPWLDAAPSGSAAGAGGRGAAAGACRGGAQPTSTAFPRRGPRMQRP